MTPLAEDDYIDAAWLSKKLKITRHRAIQFLREMPTFRAFSLRKNYATLGGFHRWQQGEKLK